MWLASAALSSQDLQDVVNFCNSDYYSFTPDWYSRSCSEIQAIVAFSWLNWIARKLDCCLSFIISTH